jgi:hypothetical protein
MRDRLTDEERAAIAAFPEERVQRIPRGESGELYWVWVARGKSGQIRHPERKQWTPWGPKKAKGAKA